MALLRHCVPAGQLVTFAPDIFNSFTFGEARYPRRVIEEAAEEVSDGKTGEWRKQATDALLRKLDAAKKQHAPVAQHKELLRDEYINALVNTIILVNRPWLNRAVKDARARLHLQGTVPSLMSTAIAGRSSVEADAGGVIGAILNFDFGLDHGKGFTGYLATSILKSFYSTEKQARNYKTIDRHTQGMGEYDRDDDTRAWVDRAAHRPDRQAMNQEMIAALHQAAEQLPGQQSRVAGLLIDRISDTGRAPHYEEVQFMFTPPLASRDRARTLVRQTWDALGLELHRIAPDMAREWKEWREIKAGLGHMGVSA